VEPFRVICETCRSRLKVSSAEAIGQIHACPKCGSMVQIVPPSDWSVGQATAVAAAATAVQQQPVLTLSTSASTVLPADFGIDLSVAPPASVPSAGVAVIPPIDPPVDAASGLSPLFWCAIGTAAAFAVAGMTYVLWPSGEKPAATTAVVAQSAATVSTSDPVAKPDDQLAETTASELPATDVEPNVVDPSEDPPVTTTAAKPVEPGPVAIAATAAPTADSPAAITTSPPNPVAPTTTAETANANPPAGAVAAPVSAAPPTATNATNEPAQVLKFDPLDFDPEHMSLSPAPANGASRASPATAGSIAPDLANAAPAPDATEGGKPPAVSDVLLSPAEHQAINVKRGPVLDDASTRQDAATRLAAPIPSLELASMPMSQFIETLSELSGVPITLDPIALEQNGMSPRTVASATATNESLDKILTDALAAQRLELAHEDGQLAVVLAGRDERKAVDFDVKDLADGADAAPIATLVEQFVAPATWKAAGGAGTIEINGATLHIDQSLAVRREALVFCERLRRARGLALRSKYPAELLTIDSPYEKLNAKLNQATTFTFMAWTRLDAVVQEWQELLGVTILVDWAALREADVGPTSQLACSTIDRPWAEAFDGVLGPLGLAWWVVDGQTIQITTADALQRIERVAFYVIPKSLREQHAASEQLVAAVELEISERPNNSGKSVAARIELDEPSARLIVRASPDVHRFLSGRFSTAK
jgi:hypothetical protein